MSIWARIKARFGRGGEGADQGDEGGELPPEEADDAEAADARASAKARGSGGIDRRVEAIGEDDAQGAGEGLSARAGEGEGEAARDEEIAKLTRVGLEGGPSAEEAIAILRRARGTVREADAVAAVWKGSGDRAVPEPVRVAGADILAARGDEAGALRLLSGVTSTAGLVLAADLYASSGQLPRAVSTIERVLGRELDAPGARERHQRWRASLGFAVTKAGHLDEATIVAANPVSGPFRLLREVARGGAGTVYEAEDELLGRRVAFKVYHGRSSAEAVLEREVRTAAALAGPGVVRVLDAGPSEGWIALEWVARGSVRDLLRSGDAGGLTPIGRWARPLARALARVHAAGMVHADVKPANVLLRQVNEPVLSDFGIARPRGSAGEGGSPGYVSPERLGGGSSDPRDDIYGFGRILEDVLHILSSRADPAMAGAATPDLAPDLNKEEVAAWRALASLCLGPAEARPADGEELVRALP